MSERRQGRPTMFQPLIDDGLVESRKDEHRKAVFACRVCRLYAKRTSYEDVARHLLSCRCVTDDGIRRRAATLLAMRQEKLRQCRDDEVKASPTGSTQKQSGPPPPGGSSSGNSVTGSPSGDGEKRLGAKRGRPTVFQPLVDGGLIEVRRKAARLDGSARAIAFACPMCNSFEGRHTYEDAARHLLFCPRVTDPGVRELVLSLLAESHGSSLASPRVVLSATSESV